MSAADMFWAAPPVSRTITAATVLLSVPVHMGLLSASYVIYYNPYVVTLRTIPQLWRLATPFFITGPKLSMILDPYFLYTYGSQLETASVRFSEPGSFLTYLVFVCTVIWLTCGVLLNGMIFLGSLTLAFAYTFAQENPTRQMSFFIITFQARWLPYAMLAMTFILDSPGSALLQATGLLGAHAYEFLARIWPEHGGGQNWLATPGVVKGWFGVPPSVGQQRSGGTAFAAQNVPQRQTGSGGGFSSGFNSGGHGSGRRLG